MAGVVNYNLTVGDHSYTGSVAYTEHVLQHYTVADAAPESAISFGGLTTADVVLIYSDQTINININLAIGTDITVDAKKPFLMTGTAVTALYITNTSGTDANVTVDMWGA